MTNRTKGKEPEVLFNSEIERTCRRNNARRKREMANQEENAPNLQVNNQAINPVANPAIRLKEIQMPILTNNPSCIRLSAAARNYELKNQHFNMLPTFNGMPSEDALGFLRDYVSIVQTFPLTPNVTEQDLFLKCFTYSLKSKARTWFLSLKEDSITTWEEIYNAFLFKFFPYCKTKELRREIHTFKQAFEEPFHEAWERYKELLRSCPHHNIQEQMVVQTFYDGLTSSSQNLVDQACHGYYGEKTSDEAYEIYENIARNHQQKAREIIRGNVNEIRTSDNFAAKLDALTKQVAMLTTPKNQNPACDYCGSFAHPTHGCMNSDIGAQEYEGVNYMGSY